MPIGPFVRRSFGRHEYRVASLYRGLFLNVHDYAAKIVGWVPSATKILEVGCGEGAVTEILANAYPEATILAIDITSRVGRLYRGRQNGVKFQQISVQEIASERRGGFDLVVLSDVLHHIPLEMRGEILTSISQCLAPGGRFLLKDWTRSATPIHGLCYAGDRWLTGDRVAYLTPSEALALVKVGAPALRAVARSSVGPWSNNYALVFEQ